MRKTMLLMALLLPRMSAGAAWEPLQDTGYSVMEIDLQSISAAGALTQVDVREVFTTPDQLASGAEYDLRVIHLLVKCAADSTAIREVEYYLKGSLVHTLSIPRERQEFLPMAGNPWFAEMVCARKGS